MIPFFDFNEKIQHEGGVFGGSTLLTNFDHEKLLLFSEAILNFKDPNLVVSAFAYCGNGNFLSGNCSLHYLGNRFKDLSDFWEEYRRIEKLKNKTK
jgi:hypothetical protein